HEGGYVAEVEVTLEFTDDAWSPYLTLADAERLDHVRRALRAGDLKAAVRYGRVFQLTPVQT
ncbi:MAG TPA: hypothetical protein VK002_11635, partial [Rubricoccaceae bacterium]|nr:hypothetical protein [Rubricoccaceae bacterium]